MRYLDNELADPKFYDRWVRDNWDEALQAVQAVDDLPPALAAEALRSHPLYVKGRHIVISAALRNAEDATPVGLSIIANRLANSEAAAESPARSRYIYGTEMDNAADAAQRAHQHLEIARRRAAGK